MVPQDSPQDKQATIAERIANTKKIPHRTDGGRKLKKKPKGIDEALKKAEEEAKQVPRKIARKRAKKKKKEKGKAPPNCRYIEGITCIYAETRWAGMADEIKIRDDLGRPKNVKFCTHICLAHVMGKHQVTNFFGMGMTLSKQLSQVIGALNTIAAGKIPKDNKPKLAETKHPLAPAVSLRTPAPTPDKKKKKPVKNDENNEQK